MELRYEEVRDVFDIKHTCATSIGYALASGIYEIRDPNLMLKSFLPDYLYVKFTNDEIILNSNSTLNKTLGFTKKIFYTILGLINCVQEC